MFDDPVLQGVERDDHSASARLQTVEGRAQPLFQPLQFVVDGDPQGLKGTGGGMDAFLPFGLAERPL